MKQLLLFIVIYFFTSNLVKGQDDDVRIFLSPNEVAIPINKKEIANKNNSFSSKYYNFCLDVPRNLKVYTENLMNDCIFEVRTKSTEISFWISEYKHMRYTQENCERMMVKKDIFKSGYNKLLQNSPSFQNAIISEDSIYVTQVGDYPSINYSCNVKNKSDDKKFNLQLTITQVFYNKFNFRLVHVYNNEFHDLKVSNQLRNKILSSFKLIQFLESLKI